MKNLILKVCILILIFVFFGGLSVNIFEKIIDREILFKAEGNKFYIQKGKQWKEFFVKGVNIGATKPGYFPGEMGVRKEDYLRWFKQISDMNANAIRIYTVLSPDFYNALYEYNKYAKKPLYLFQGVVLNEGDVLEYSDAYNPVISEQFEKEIYKAVNVLHGNINIAFERGHAHGEYKNDVSKYVIGYILGIEIEAEFVEGTNEKNPEKNNFDGDYLYTEDASPYEAWLAWAGDILLNYEVENYDSQKMISWINWPTTDMLTHDNEPLEREDIVSVDFENIKSKENLESGIFASYHIYPYYPEFMFYQPEYASFVDEKGNLNPYKAYLKDLINPHDMPALIAEFGIPTSRGLSHINVVSGYNQGFLTEEQQGEILRNMYQDIKDTQYCGALIFVWQDEWFKKSWNTSDFDNPERRPYWSNYQVAEQNFGLLSFEPGNQETMCYTDGQIEDWKKVKPLISNNGETELYVKNDERYLYIMIKDTNYKNKEKYVIGLDTIDKQGNFKYNDMNLNFDIASDFIVVIDGKENSSVYNDAYYDTTYHYYANYENLNIAEYIEAYHNKNSGIFTQVTQCLTRPFVLPKTKERIPFTIHDTGKLTYGNSNPESKNYNSLSDFYINNDIVEIRIPWMVLNFSDPSQHQILDDFYKDGEFKIDSIETEGIKFQLIEQSNNNIIEKSDIGFYTWDKWDIPFYNERLKKSYYYVKDMYLKD